MTKRDKNKNTGLTYRIIGIFMLAGAAFLFFSLFSFSPDDPSFFHSSHISGTGNAMGIVGSYTSGMLLYAFGLCSFAIPLFLAEYAYLYLIRRQALHWLKSLSTGIIFLVFIIFMGIFFDQSLIFSSNDIMASGYIGAIAGQALKNYLNAWGAMVVLVPVLCAGIMAGYDIPRLYSSAKNLVLNCIERRSQSVKGQNENPIARKTAPQKTASKKNTRITITKNTPLTQDTPIQSQLDFMDTYQLPMISLLDKTKETKKRVTQKELKANAELIEAKLRDFGVKGEILEIKPGPLITMYEFTPAPGIKINRIVSLADDLAMALKASPVRVVAPIPGKNAVGIEIPNKYRQNVYLRSILSSQEFVSARSPLTMALGANIEGMPVVVNLEKMPHLLVAGATGTGKSVGLNTMIISLLYRNSPDELKFIMIDPKRIELSYYEDIPHLIHPVVTDPAEALPVLKWAAAEMEIRYEFFKNTGVKGINTFNKKIKKENKKASPMLASVVKKDEAFGILPRLVVVIDELADLMMVNKEVEGYIARLAQMARAAGIYMVVATQRPSVDVVTGLIKANFPARVSFRVSSKIDSRTILDASGAEQLLGLGDMLLLSPGQSNLRRIHGAYVSEEELDGVVNFIKKQKAPEYVEDIDKQIAIDSQKGTGASSDEYDPKYDEALEFVIKKGSASISLIQRRFRIGYNRAARIVEQMETDKIIGPADTAGKPRKVLVKGYDKDMED
ncbi:MAG: DNA translocase FtsK 4TM domain-containing protein [Thermodesulfobacteriota bacterium]|nr:DNA translocase FtsK 4TM domain-containing protein [Thermodesulfobacteriota bacterium]